MTVAMTDRMRAAYSACFICVIIFAIAGWLTGHDVTMLTPILAAATTAALGGEASNIGKRATYKPEADKRN